MAAWPPFSQTYNTYQINNKGLSFDLCTYNFNTGVVVQIKFPPRLKDSA
jgi:hypothetical protein